MHLVALLAAEADVLDAAVAVAVRLGADGEGDGDRRRGGQPAEVERGLARRGGLVPGDLQLVERAAAVGRVRIEERAHAGPDRQLVGEQVDRRAAAGAL